MDSSERCQLTVVQFLTPGNGSASEIYRRKQNVHCPLRFSLRSVFRWRDFHSGNSGTDNISRPSQEIVVITKKTVVDVNRYVRINRRIITFVNSRGSIYEQRSILPILQERLQYR
ncbi:hypothetical protein TNIN_35181 [Trichonephila inaurata madagascariensis]|uniref:Uncharacterized protein n=1 Tax=Trichonephila inaurata madagascariensis TaxID=2747483 RepID=A0A8X7CL28_9ARAC|nr:hypothetical protein TNIN_35181 [Trichonephila inaurata madagascariensis]